MSSKRKSARKNGYDSHLERELHEGPLAGALYHPTKINYLIPARYAYYEPDFQIGNKLVEAKGRIRNATEAAKYKHINSELKGTQWELVFVLQNPDLPMPGAKKRKSGDKRTHAEWLDSLGIRWYSAKNAHLIWEDT